MTRTLMVLLVLGVGCGDDDATPDSGTPIDGGVDTAQDAPEMDAGADAEPGFDAGPVDYPACNPLLGADACPADERCGLISDEGEVSFVCRFDGDVPEGGDCEFSRSMASDVFWDDCTDGTFCTPFGPGSGLQCRRPCVTQADCAAGEECLLVVVDAAPLPEVGTCRAPDVCDPVSDTGCDADERCTLARLTGSTFQGTTVCDETGDRGLAESCQRFSELTCASGLHCSSQLNPDGSFVEGGRARCVDHCDPASSESCPTGETCIAFTPDAGVCTEPPLPQLEGSGRPADVYVPTAHDGSTALPAFMFLHGYSGTGAAYDLYLRLIREAERVGAYLILPNGNVDSNNAQFWNATDACCDADGSDPDDSTYLSGLVTELAATYPIDADRVFLFGHSNGGFMSYRLSCDHADTFAAMASLAGSTFEMETDCMASQPVSVLQLHGTNDTLVPFDGRPGMYPGARDTAERWATRAGCDIDMSVDGTPFDIDDTVEGPETTPTTWSTGCDTGIEVSLWTMDESGHSPDPSDDFTRRVFDWLMAHPR